MGKKISKPKPSTCAENVWKKCFVGEPGGIEFLAWLSISGRESPPLLPVQISLDYKLTPPEGSRDSKRMVKLISDTILSHPEKVESFYAKTTDLERFGVLRVPTNNPLYSQLERNYTIEAFKKGNMKIVDVDDPDEE